MKKFELTTECITVCGEKLFRIRAILPFENIEAGELGGYIAKEENLDHDGTAWVAENAHVFGNARVSGNARVAGNAYVFENAHVAGNAYVGGRSCVFDNAHVAGNARATENAHVCGDAYVVGNACACGNVHVAGNALVAGNARVSGESYVVGTACVVRDADYASVKGFGRMHRHTTFFRCADGIVRVRCGCFYGQIPEFRERVKNTSSGKIRKEYLTIADLMEYHFSEENDTQERTDES